MKTALKTLSAACLLAMAVPAQSQILWDTLYDGIQNLYEDQNRESIFDVDGDGGVSAGDVFVGYVRLDDNTIPGYGDLNNELYGIFSIEVETITPTVEGYQIVYTDTSNDGLGLSLTELMGGDPNAVGNLAAIYEDVNQNLISDQPGDVDGDGVLTVFDYIAEITNDTLDLIAGIETTSGPNEDHWVADITLTGAVDPIANLVLLESATISSGLPDTTIDFHAGLGITWADPAGGYAEDCTLNPAVSETCFAKLALDVTDGPSLHEGLLENGTISGAADLNNVLSPGVGNGFFSGSSFLAQGNGTWNGLNFYGLSSNADFGIFPYSNRVPEPTTIALMGLGLIGMGATRRRRKA